MYLDQVRQHRERRSFQEAVDAEIAALAAGQLAPDVRQRYVWGGLYSDHIRRWQRVYGEDRVHVVLLEELTRSPARVWADLAEFLDHDLGPVLFEAVSERDRNPSGTLRWPRMNDFIRSFEGRDSPVIEAAKHVLPPGLHRRLLQRVSRLNRSLGTEPKIQPDQETLARLDDFYRPEVDRMVALLHRPLAEWSTPRDGAVHDTRSSAAPAPPASMRILHLVSRSHRRGAELVALELADELDRRGHRNRVLALGPSLDGGHDPRLTPLASSRGAGVPELVSGAWRLRRVLADEPVDAVLAHGGWAAQVAALAMPRGGPLLVWQRILDFPDKVWGPVRRHYLAAVARRVDVGVALTDGLEGELRRLGFEGPVWVIPNSRKPDRFLAVDRAVAATGLRTEIGVPSGTPLIGFVGHLVRQKRPERALGVLALLRAQGRGVHLVVAGSGPLRSDLELRARDLGVAHAVAFLGHRSDVELVFGGVDVVLLTSEAEGVPGVAIEAVMAGCPMVTVPVGGVAEVVEHGATGLLLGGTDPAEMAAAVAALLDDDATRAAMSRKGREQAASFAASTTAAIYAERLSAVLAGR
jgi:glycosyltransferase involved in cell wall biosynthesis